MLNSALTKISNNKYLSRHVDKAVNNELYAARALVVSNVMKDAAVYTFRFNKTVNNKEIPEDKRKFVAGLDLASGVTTCLVQLGLGFAFTNKKVQSKLCKTLFGKFTDVSPNLVNKAKKGFVAGASLILSGVIGERVIVPLISTPLASVVENKLLKKSPEESTCNKISVDKDLYKIYNNFVKSTKK